VRGAAAPLHVDAMRGAPDGLAHRAAQHVLKRIG
jgi:hypothetical protein